MHWIGRKRLSRLHRDRMLSLGHIGYLTLLLERMNTDTGYIEISATGMAEEQKLQRTFSSRYLNVLVDHGLLARVPCKRTKAMRYLPHPYLLSAGGAQKRGFLWAQFAAAREEDLAELEAEVRAWAEAPGLDELNEDCGAAEEAAAAAKRRGRLAHRQRLKEAAGDRRRRELVEAGR
jgi:hypothetical protein